MMMIVMSRLGSDWLIIWAQRVDVVGVVAHDIAALVRVEVADRQVLHAVEHHLAQLLERALRDDSHGAVPEERGQDADAVDAGEGGHELCDLGRAASQSPTATIRQ